MADLDTRKLAEQHYDRGIDALADGEFAPAAECFREAIAIDATFLDARHGLIRALQDAGQFDEAISTAQQLAIEDPDDVLAHTRLSILYQHKGMIPEAEAESARAKILGWKLELSQPKPKP
jgi:tetratricopeptide (TPR) repeat protein